MLKNKTNEELMNELIDLGYELEANDYNRKFEGYEGFEPKTLNNERRNLLKKAHRRVEELIKRDVDIWYNDYSYTDENGIEWELEYASQFF